MDTPKLKSQMRVANTNQEATETRAVPSGLVRSPRPKIQVPPDTGSYWGLPSCIEMGKFLPQRERNISEDIKQPGTGVTALSQKHRGQDGKGAQ